MKQHPLWIRCGLWLLVTLSVLVSRVAAVAQDSKRPNPEDLVARARQLIEKKDYAAARLATQPFLEDKDLASGPLRPRALLLHGIACYFLNDDGAAGRALSLLAPFDQPDCGSRARYLLARIHQRSDERNEALLHFQAVIADEQAAAETVQRARFCLAVLLFEDGRFAEARTLHGCDRGTTC